MSTTVVVPPPENESSGESPMIASQEIGVQLGVLRQEIINSRPDLAPVVNRLEELSQTQASLLGQFQELREKVNQIEVVTEENPIPLETPTAVIVEAPPIAEASEQEPEKPQNKSKRTGIARMFLGE